MRMTGEEHVDRGVCLGHELVELGVRGQRVLEALGRGRTEVGLDDRHVRLFVRGKFLDLVGDPIDRVGRVTEFDAFDARGRDQRRGFLRDDADDGDLDTADVDDRVLLEAVGDVL